MTRIPTDFSGRALVRALEKVGFVVKHQRGATSFFVATILLLELPFPITRPSASEPSLNFNSAGITVEDLLKLL